MTSSRLADSVNGTLSTKQTSTVAAVPRTQDKIHTGKRPTLGRVLADSRVLRLGVKLLGFFFLGSAVPRLGSTLVRAIFEHHGDFPMSSVFPFLLGSFIPLIQIAIALFFILDTNRVVQHIGRCREVEREHDDVTPPLKEEPHERHPSR